MKCEIIRDLMPLYLDDCCSDGSRKLVEEHIETCGSCRKLLGEMSQELVIGTEERQHNLLEEELLKTGKEVIKTEVREDYLENIIWMDIPLNIIVFIFGIIAMLKYDADQLYLYTYEQIAKLGREESMWIDIYTNMGNPLNMGITLYFLAGEVIYLLNAKKKRQNAILTCTALQSIFYKFVMLVTLAAIGLMLMLRG